MDINAEAIHLNKSLGSTRKPILKPSKNITLTRRQQEQLEQYAAEHGLTVEEALKEGNNA